MAVFVSSMVGSPLSNLELLLVEFGDRLPHTLLEVCSAHKDRVEIKCMGYVGGKTPIEPNLYLFIYFFSLRHIKSCYG
jgi:hypothetical protein